MLDLSKKINKHKKIADKKILSKLHKHYECINNEKKTLKIFSEVNRGYLSKEYLSVVKLLMPENKNETNRFILPISVNRHYHEVSVTNRGEDDEYDAEITINDQESRLYNPLIAILLLGVMVSSMGILVNLKTGKFKVTKPAIYARE